jgi:uncharacterized repeat protein (TIGR02543 family)
MFTVSGTVKDPDGNGLESVTIAYTISGTSGFTSTCGNGLYSITAQVGQTVTITDVVLAGYSAIESMPSAFTSNGTANFTMIWDGVTHYTLSAGTAVNGTIEWFDGNGWITLTSTPVTFAPGISVQLRAVADAGHLLSYWTGSLSGNTDLLSVVMSDDMMIGAVFVHGSDSHTISITLSVTGSMTGTGSVYAIIDGNIITKELAGMVSSTLTLTVRTGAIVSMTAIGTDGYVFSHWAGAHPSLSEAIGFTVLGNLAVEAVFVSGAASYELSANTVTNGTIEWFDGNGWITLTSTPVTFAPGTQVQIRAAAADGHTFSHWTGNHSGNENPSSVTMNGDRVVGAVFVQNVTAFTLSAGTVVNGTIQWSLNGIHWNTLTSVTLTEGTQVHVRAMASGGGHTFSHWTGHLSGNVNPSVVIMDGNKVVGAVFAPVVTDFTLFAHATVNGTIEWFNGTNWVTLTSTPVTFSPGTVVPLRAVSADGHEFQRWTDSLSGTLNPSSVTMNMNRAVGAVFTQEVTVTWFTLSAGAAINGTIQWSADRMNWHTLTSVTFASGTFVHLRAVSDTGHVFQQWTGHLSGDVNPSVVMMNGDRVVGAIFVPVAAVTDFRLSAHATTNGTIEWFNGTNWITLTSAPVMFTPGAQVQIRAVAADGHTFSHWTGNHSGTANPSAVTMNMNRVIGAVFVNEDASHTLNITLTGTGSMTGVGVVHVTIDGEMITKELRGMVSSTLTLDVRSGATVFLTATGMNGYVFSHWTGDRQSSWQTIGFTIYSNMAVEAVFISETASYTLSAGERNHGTIQWSLDRTSWITLTSAPVPFLPETSVYLRSVSDIGYLFSHWTGSLNSNDDPAALTMDGNKVVGAVFVHSGDSYILSITLTGQGSPAGTGMVRMLIDGNVVTVDIIGIVSSTTTINIRSGAAISMTATGTNGFVFSQWTGDHASSPRTINFTMAGNTSVGAVFVSSITIHTLSAGATANGTIQWSLDGTNWYALTSVQITSGTQVQVRAMAAEGHTFLQWSGSLSGNLNPNLLTMNSNMHVGALFILGQEETFTVSGNVTFEGDPLESVRIDYSEGGSLMTVYTDASGTFLMTVQAGLTVTITAVTLDGYELSPSGAVSRDLGNVISDLNNIDFTMIISIPPVGSTFDIGDLRFTVTVEGSEVIVSARTSEISGDLVIPPTVSHSRITYSVVGMGDYAFSWSNLTSIFIPDSVISIGTGAFDNNKSLTSITVDPSNPNFSSVDGVLFNKDKSLLIQYPIGNSATSYAVPHSVTSIGDGAFASNINLTSVIIGNSVASIGNGAFMSTGLTSMNIPDSVIIIGSSAFSWNGDLASVTIGNSVTEIEGDAFRGTGLTSISIPASVTWIGSEAFADNKSLTSITVDPSNPNFSSVDGVLFDKDKSLLVQYPIGNPSTSYVIPDSVITIGSSAFAGSANLTSVTIPDSVMWIASGAFTDNTSLTSITVDPSNPNFSSVDGVLFNKDKSLLIQYPIGNSATSYVIPDSVITIGSSAFAGSANLTSVTIGNSVTEIGWGAFQSTGLTSVTIPDSVTYIGPGAFLNCNNLMVISIPPGLDYSHAGIPSTATITNHYYIGLVSNGGSSVAPIVGGVGTSVTVPANPTKQGFTFAGWYSNQELTVPFVFPDIMIAEHITAYAKWEEIVYVNQIMVSGADGATTITTYGGTLQKFASVLPGNVTDGAVTWSVIPGTGTASISPTGLLTALTNGTVIVKATANDGSGVYGEMLVMISGQSHDNGGSGLDPMIIAIIAIIAIGGVGAVFFKIKKR